MTQTAQTAPVLTQKIRINATPERIYRALTDASELVKWFFDDKAETDPRVGGQLRYVHTNGCVVTGTYLELVPNQLVKYSWHEELEDETRLSNLTVTFRLEPHGEYTDLVIEESGYENDEYHLGWHGRRIEGWTYFIGNLKSLLETGTVTR